MSNTNNGLANEIVGWFFVVLDNNLLVAQGRIIGIVGHTYLVQFGFDIKTQFNRLMAPEQMNVMALFPSNEAMQSFLAAAEGVETAAVAPADSKKTPAKPRQKKGSPSPKTKLRKGPPPAA